MNIFLINYILMLVEAAILLYAPKNNPRATEEEIAKKKKSFVILQCVQWVLISCLRADTVGADTQSYAWMYDMHRDLSWYDLFEYFKTYYFEEAPVNGFEPGYMFFEKLIMTIWDNQVFYKFSIAAIFMSALGRFVYKNSDDPFIAFMLYSGLFYNMFSLTGYRQVLSVAIGILWAYEYIKERKLFKFLLLVFLASLIHKSTLIFIPFYFISQKKISAAYAVSAGIAILIMIAYREQLFNIIKGLVGYEEYGTHGGFTQRNFIMMFGALAFLAIWRFPLIIKEYPGAYMYYNGLIMSAAMLSFAMVSPTAMRLVYDFAFTLMLLVPKVFKSFNRKDTVIAYTVSILIFGFFVTTRAVPYEFFW